MRKFYTCLVLFSMFLTLALKSNAQVNYVFSTKQSTYKPLINATRLSMSDPTPTGYYEEDEGFVNNLPIGFLFTFNNQQYSTLNINVNGFVTFGAPFTIDVNDRYSTNSLAKGPKQGNGIYGIIAPLWDDLRLQDTFSLKYQIDGTAPNRTFTVEWGNVSWNYNSLDTAISFQMRLYETSNAIEFLYQPLNGAATNASASIGLATCTNCIGSFLSVGGSGESTSVSGVKEYDEISAKPQAGKSYFFEPGLCGTVQTLNLGNYNSRNASFSWNSTSSSGYDYAISTSPLQPLIFSSTTNNNVTIGSLQPGTQYYMHVRSGCNSTAKSGWATYTFKTPCEVALPYKENFENTSAGKLPSCIITNNPNGGNPWQLTSLAKLPPYNNVISFEGDNIQQADAWFVLPAANLEGGKSYRLKFKYKVGDTLGINQKIEVRIGTIINSNFSGWSVVYRNVKLSGFNFSDTSFLFAPPADNIYFLAFRCYSDRNASSLSIDNIELSVVKPIPVKMVYFTGTRVSEKNVLSWRTSSEIKNRGFELQRGIDGENFSTIKSIASKAINGNSIVSLDYTTNDSLPFIGSTYYRLKVIDTDDGEYYTQAIVVKAALPYQVTYSKIYPNPVSDVVTVVMTSPYATKANFVIADAYGKVAINIAMLLTKGDNIIKVDVGKLGRGVYMSKLYCTLGESPEGKSFIKQ